MTRALGRTATWWVLAIWLVPLLPAQLVIKQEIEVEPPPGPVELEEVEKGPVEFVYEGVPMQVPLECLQSNFTGTGAHCSEDTPCELFLELIGIAEGSAGVVVAGNIHTPAATIVSLVLVSQDGGVTWREGAERQVSAVLDGVNFVDKDHGFISGQEWQLDDAVRPFFLVTTNGGKRWLRYNVWDEEERFGSILEYRFDSPDHGYLIIERMGSDSDPYELFESMNSGRSWLIRRISDSKPELRRRPTVEEDPSVRLVEDPATRTYGVEKRDGASWQLAARFSLDVTVCASMETEITAGPSVFPNNPETPDIP